jgi:NitT/TauT family transport system substrate-binding protein
MADDEIEKARRLVAGTGWKNPSEKARKEGVSRREFMRESGLASLAAAGGAGAVSGCLGGGGNGDGNTSNGGGNGDDPTAQVGYIPITDASPLLTAYANDHFADNGVEAEEPELFRGWSELAEAFFGGSVNIAHFLMPMTVWMRYNLEENVQVVAWDHMDGSALTVRDGIDNWSDLGGGRVAVPFWYSIHNVVLQMGLRREGLTPLLDDTDPSEDEVSLVVQPPPDMPSSLAEGNTDGYIVAEPFNAIGELESGGNVLRFTGDIWRQHACCVVVMREDLLESNPEWSRSVMDSIVEAQSWIRGNRGEAATLLSNEGSGLLDYSRQQIDRAMNHYDLEEYGEQNGNGAIKHPEWENERIGFYPYPYRSYTEELVRRLKETEVEGEAEFLKDVEPGFAADDLVSYEPVRSSLEAAGGPSEFDIEEQNGYEREERIEF